jgi:hypothetical protein
LYQLIPFWYRDHVKYMYNKNSVLLATIFGFFVHKEVWCIINAGNVHVKDSAMPQNIAPFSSRQSVCIVLNEGKVASTDKLVWAINAEVGYDRPQLLALCSNFEQFSPRIRVDLKI